MKFLNNVECVDSDHYVALLSNGNNPPATESFSQKQLYIKKQRALSLGSRVARFAAFVIGLSLIGGIFVAFRSSQLEKDDLALLSTSISNIRLSHDSSGDSLVGAVRNIRAFEEFIRKYGRVYPTFEERKRRLDIFAQNLLLIDLHNSQNFTYTLAANEFTDLTYDEFKAHHFTGYRKRSNLGVDREGITDWSLIHVDELTLPSSINWKDRGCVTEVRDQRKCGSCWAFSSAGAVEGAFCLKHGKLISLSEQQMVDCASPEGNDGCNGGEMDDAFQYIIDHGGLCSDKDYPYRAEDGHCHDDRCTAVASVLRFADIPHGSEKAMKAAVASKGPIAVAIQADETAFQFYSRGVFDSPCGTDLNHGVLVVGYDSDSADSKKDYWLVKNSWGTSWGEKGFMKLIRNDGSRSGRCGVLLDASYPIVQ